MPCSSAQQRTAALAQQSETLCFAVLCRHGRSSFMISKTPLMLIFRYLVHFSIPRFLCGYFVLSKLNMAIFPHSSHQGPKTRDETKQDYLPRPVRDPEQSRAPAARRVRRGIHGIGQITLPATTARHSINTRTDAERDKRDVRFFFVFWAVYA